MATVMLRRVPGGTLWSDDINQLVDVGLGNLGSRWNLIGYDGIEKHPNTGATVSSNNYALDVMAAGSNQARFRASGGGNLLLVQDSGLTFGSGVTAGGDIIPSASNTYDLGSGVAYWDDIHADQLHSHIATGTAPLVVQSTTEVANLNASRVAGKIPTGTPAANALPLADGSGTLNSWVTSFTGGTLTGQLLLSNNTSTGGWAYDGDANTGGRYVSSELHALYANGVNTLYVGQSSGQARVGIGVSPTHVLHIQDSQASNFLINANNTGANGNGMKMASASTAGTDALFYYETGGVFRGAIWCDGGMTLGNPTGGNKGTGTLNAQAVYDDNVLLTDWIFDLAYDGQVWPEDDGPHVSRLLTIAETEAFAREHRHLPHIPGRDEWKRNGEAFSLGTLVQAHWETIERLSLHVFDLNRRLSALEHA